MSSEKGVAEYVLFINFSVGILWEFEKFFAFFSSDLKKNLLLFGLTRCGFLC